MRLPPGSRAACFLSIGVLVFANGFLRGEPASLLAGSGLLATALTAFVGVIVEKLRLRSSLRREPSAFDPSLFKQGDSPDGPVFALSVSSRCSYTPFMPLVHARCAIRLRARNGRRAGANVPLPGPFASGTASLHGEKPYTASLGMGKYSAPDASLELYDIFGFFTMGIPVCGPFELLSTPAETKIATDNRRTSGGFHVRDGGRTDRDDEPYDSRVYIPGDDPRRINWKQFSHSGELFLRIGEPVPPPRSLVVIALDSELPPWLSRKARHFRTASLVFLDALASTAIACANEAAQAGYETLFIMPDVVSESSEAARFFSDAAWDDGSGSLELPAVLSSRIVCVCLPGGRRAPHVQKSAMSRNAAFVMLHPEMPIMRRTMLECVQDFFFKRRSPPVTAPSLLNAYRHALETGVNQGVEKIHAGA